MKLSEELKWRGFVAENTFSDITDLDKGSRKFYFGADPSADSLTIGNLASLMMVYCFVRHDYEPHLLIGGATGMIGDPKDTEERRLKPLDEINKNKEAIVGQFKRILKVDDRFKMVDNYDWFKDIRYLDFLRDVGKHFSMTQLLDREFVKSRVGEGKSGLSYAEFSYSLIQGYDYLHLFKNYGVTMQLCGADQWGNSVSGMHLIKRLEGADVDVWSMPLVINQATGRKFGKSEAGAVWLDEGKTSVYDFYQFWLNVDDEGVDYYLKIYTLLSKEEIDEIMQNHAKNPSERLAQKALAYGVTSVVHGADKADSAVKITDVLFNGSGVSGLNERDISILEKSIPVSYIGKTVVDILVDTKEVTSKGEARRLIESGAITIENEKVSNDTVINKLTLIKKGKNKFILIK